MGLACGILDGKSPAIPCAWPAAGGGGRRVERRYAQDLAGAKILLVDMQDISLSDGAFCCNIPHVIDLLLAQDMLGLQKHGEFRSEKENVDEDILTMGRGLATVEIDIMAPLDVNKSPKVIYFNHLVVAVFDLIALVNFLSREN